MVGSGLVALSVSVLEHAVVEDVAVLVDLDERRALVGGRACEASAQVLMSTSSVRATKVASAPSASDSGLSGWSIEPIGVDFGLLAAARDVGEYCPLVRP